MGTTGRRIVSLAGPIPCLLMRGCIMDRPFVFTLPALSPTAGPPEGRSLLAATQAKMGMVPNMCARMANAPALLQTYSEGYARFRTDSGFSPIEQEVVFLSISQENGCDYCLAAHSYLATTHARMASTNVAALRLGTSLPDARLDALSDFTHVLVAMGGRPSHSAAATF